MRRYTTKAQDREFLLACIAAQRTDWQVGEVAVTYQKKVATITAIAVSDDLMDGLV